MDTVSMIDPILMLSSISFRFQKLRSPFQEHSTCVFNPFARAHIAGEFWEQGVVGVREAVGLS